MNAQKTNATLRSEADTLKKENVNLKLQIKSQKGGNTNLTVSEDEIKRSITHWAKFFQLFYSAVLTIDSFNTKKPDFAHDDPEHFQGDNTKLGRTAELYAIIPRNIMTKLVQFDSIAKHVSDHH
jgi:hypothetical protein